MLMQIFRRPRCGQGLKLALDRIPKMVRCGRCKGKFKTPPCRRIAVLAGKLVGRLTQLKFGRN